MAPSNNPYGLSERRSSARVIAASPTYLKTHDLCRLHGCSRANKFPPMTTTARSRALYTFVSTLACAATSGCTNLTADGEFIEEGDALESASFTEDALVPSGTAACLDIGLTVLTVCYVCDC